MRYLLIFFFSLNVFSGDAHQDSILVVANETSQALVEGRYDDFVKHCHPIILFMSGGPEKLIEVLRAELKKMGDEGVQIISSKAIEVSKIYPAGKELHALVTMSLKIKIPEGHLIQKLGPTLCLECRPR